MPEHAVIITFSYTESDLEPLYALEEELECAIEKAGAGEYDGNEIALGGGDSRLYMYGPDALKLFAAVEPVLIKRESMRGAKATLRFGPPDAGVREVVITFGS